MGSDPTDTSHLRLVWPRNPRATWDAVNTVARAGRVVLVGMGGDAVRLPLSAEGRVQLDPLVTGHYGLDHVEEALKAPRQDPTTVKPIIRPGE